MHKLRLVLIIIIASIVAYFLIRIIIEPSFKVVNSDSLEMETYAIDELEDRERVKSYRNGRFRIESIYPTKNRRTLYFQNNEYWVFWTGVVSLDAGVKFFYTPRYSRILIVDRETKEMVSNKLFLRRITNASIQDGYVYFVYAGWTGYNLGRFKLNE